MAQEFQDTISADSQEDQTIDAMIKYSSKRLLEGATTGQIADELVNNGGWSRADVEPLVGAVYNQMNMQTNAAIADAYKKRIFTGLLWMLGGGAISLITYLAASGGGVYFVFWGAVVWGGVDVVRGLVGWLANR